MIDGALNAKQPDWTDGCCDGETKQNALREGRHGRVNAVLWSSQIGPDQLRDLKNANRDDHCTGNLIDHL